MRNQHHLLQPVHLDQELELIHHPLFLQVRLRMPRQPRRPPRQRHPVIPRQPQPILQEVVEVLADSTVRTINRRGSDPVPVIRQTTLVRRRGGCGHELFLRRNFHRPNSTWRRRLHGPTFSPPLSTFSFVYSFVPRIICRVGFFPAKISRHAPIASFAPFGYSNVASRIPFFTASIPSFGSASTPTNFISFSRPASFATSYAAIAAGSFAPYTS